MWNLFPHWKHLSSTGVSNLWFTGKIFDQRLCPNVMTVHSWASAVCLRPLVFTVRRSSKVSEKKKKRSAVKLWHQYSSIRSLQKFLKLSIESYRAPNIT